MDTVNPSLLIVEDNEVFIERLAKAMTKRGFTVFTALGIHDVETHLNAHLSPDYAIVDMKLEDGNGLDVMQKLHQANPQIRAIMLTAYANIASAVASIKFGAIDYLPKPADADQIYNALMGLVKIQETTDEEELVMTPNRLKWEYIQRAFEECEHNVSATARRLKMHRRTLQRILAKYAPK